MNDLLCTLHLPVLHEQQKQFITSPAKRNIVRAGRRSGKTTGVSDLAVNEFINGRRVLYATPTQEQVERFWYTVKSIMKEPLDAGVYYKNESRHIIEMSGTNARIRAKTAWNADTLRGDYADLLILDEAQLMAEEALELVGLPMLIDNDGVLYVIYTPPSLETAKRSKARNPRWVAELYQNALKDTTGRWQAHHFTSLDNPYISQSAVEELAMDMSATAYRMEIMAEDLDEAPGALWKREDIDKNRLNKLPDDGCSLLVVGADPSATSTGDETGIIVSGMLQDHYFVIEDNSLSGSPLEWATAVVQSYYRNKADVIIAESNQGGEMVEAVIKQVDKKVPVKLIHATRGKQTRAMPVATLAEKGKVHHVGKFSRLEDELCLWTPNSPDSPNRLDAMVWAISYLADKNDARKKAKSHQG